MTLVNKTSSFINYYLLGQLFSTNYQLAGSPCEAKCVGILRAIVVFEVLMAIRIIDDYVLVTPPNG